MDAASGTRIMWSIAPGTKDGSTRGRPTPSFRDGRGQVTVMSPVTQAS